MLNASWNKCKIHHLKCQLVRQEDLHDLKDLGEKTISLASEHLGKQQHQCGGQWRKRGKEVSN